MLPKKSKAEKLKELKPVGAGVVDKEEEEFKKDLEEYAHLESLNNEWASTIHVVQDMVRMKQQAIQEFNLYMKVQRNHMDVLMTQQVAKEIETGRVSLELVAVDQAALRRIFSGEANRQNGEEEIG